MPVVTALHLIETVVLETVTVQVVVTPADPVAMNEDEYDAELVAVTVAALFTALNLNSSDTVAISVASLISVVAENFPPTTVREVGTVKVQIVVALFVVSVTAEDETWNLS